ncbi:uncharacterized protein F4822DRAFT_396195 [Hypoxylon trugodes]|uniref:uncharacterized protein n=1 Tax=Hypoxylon trugodes TaxID=326681 RepID=UPI00219310FD|nr:uncharacterized protein F4822DRAFT_396195 [Hypoxylon trugodes]KAI1391276.1 hypothetical protein F4822DRAFT_396195 [Hypoxylon trugodes]
MADTPFPLPPFPSSQLRVHSPPSARSVVSGATNETNTRRRSLPVVFPPLFPKNTSSTFLIPSTAEGKPIPLDGSTATHRTTTLRQLSRSQPSSRRRYDRTTGPPSIKSTTTGTYSQPVIVRTYSGVPTSSTARGPVSVSTVEPTTNPSPRLPSRNGPIKNMVRQKGIEKARATADAKLPPLESFTFKSIIADIQQDVGADLDRIAEICARTRYSLSNQYEVHIAPQGSGAGFLGPPSASSRHHIPIGPTLQAISSDDEHAGAVQRSKRSAVRRRSIAYGTLETIISSSRSSDEDKSKKKPAAEIVEEVRGRATTATKEESGSTNCADAQEVSEQQVHHPSRSALFATAIIDTSRSQTQSNLAAGTIPGASLLSEPAEPHTSRNHLQTKTSPEGPKIKHYKREPPPQPSRAIACESMAAGAIAPLDEPKSPSSLLSGFSAWIPWMGTSIPIPEIDTSRGSSYAEGALRELLKSTGSQGE